MQYNRARQEGTDHRTDRTIPTGSHGILRRHYRDARKLPAPQTEWTNDDVGLPQPVLLKFKEKGIITHVGWTEYEYQGVESYICRVDGCDAEFDAAHALATHVNYTHGGYGDEINHYRDTSSEYYRIYQTAAGAYDYVQRIDGPTTGYLPCGHRPFTNPRDVDGYGCSDDDCDAVFDRATVEACLGGGYDA